MRILYLHRTQARGVEGVHIRGIVDAMREAGHELRVLGPEGTDPYGATAAGKAGAAARFARHAPRLLFEVAELAYDRRLAGRLQALARDFEPELIYERYAFFARAGSDLAQRLGLPHILEVNYTVSDPLFRRRSRLLTPAARRVEAEVFRRARLLAAVSSRLVERIEAQGVDAARVVMTPNAVDRRWWRQAAAVTPQALPPRWAELPVTGFVGGFFPWHGLDLLVDAVDRCRQQGLDSALLLLGDGPERPRIQEQIEAAGLTDRALLPGAIPHGELAPWIAAMDLCVMPSSNDYGSPMKIFEYMALGKAVLAPDLPPLRDVIRSGETGLLFAPPGAGAPTAEPLAGGLAELLAQPASREAMGREARRQVGEFHTWQENLRRVFLAAALADPFPAGSDAPRPTEAP